jgi:hypothetical protein
MDAFDQDQSIKKSEMADADAEFDRAMSRE